MLLLTKKAGSSHLELTSKEARPVQKGVEGTGRDHASLREQQWLVGTVPKCSCPSGASQVPLARHLLPSPLQLREGGLSAPCSQMGPLGKSVKTKH